MKLCSFSVSSVFTAAVILAVQVASGSEILLQENFESYSNDVELETVWPSVGNAVTRLAEDPANPDNATLSSKGDRRTRTFDSLTPTNDEPLHVTADYHDNYEIDVPGRDYIGLWAGPFDHGNRLIEVGLFNNAAENATNRYTARVFGSEHGSSWFDLNTARKGGWRKIELWIFSDTVEIYLDGELDTVVAWAGGALGAIRLGFGAGTGETASLTRVHYDNLVIERIQTSGGQGTLIELSEVFTDGTSDDPYQLDSSCGTVKSGA